MNLAFFCACLARWRVLVAAAMALLFFSLPSLAAPLDLTPEEKAFIESHPVITVSDVDWQPLSIVTEGRQQGLFHDYYALIAQRTGLAFRFVPFGDGLDFQLVLDALRDKRIDMIDGTGKTTDRARYALFAGPFWQFPLSVASRDDGAAYSLESLVGKRVAVARGSTAEEYLREHVSGLDLVESSDPFTAMALVATHKAEAAVENMAVAAYVIRKGGLANVKISGLLDYQFKIYSLVRNDWPQLATILQKAHDSITETEKAELLAKWLPLYKEGVQSGEKVGGPGAKTTDNKSSIVLTDREREYLAGKKALAFCVDPDWAPIERIDENGRHVGIAADFLALMSERLGGVSTVLLPTASWGQSLAAVKARRCDFLTAAGDTKDRRRFLNFTTPYLRFPMVVATRAKAPFIEDPSALSGRTLGVVNGYSSLDILRAKYPEMHLMEVASVSEGLRLVAEGKLFGYIDTVPAISQAIAKDHFSDLKIAGRLDAHLDLSVASRDDEPELASLFQKAVNSLTKEESDAIIKKWVAVTFEEHFDYSRLWKILSGVAVALCFVIWWNRKLARLNRVIRQAHESLDGANRRMTALLDNAGQGFLSVGRDGVVEPQCSRECRSIFGGDIVGRDVAALLFPDDSDGRESMAGNIRRIVDEADAYRRDLYVSLMPKLLLRGETALRVAYRPLADARLMFVLTDVTGEIRLKDAVARERNRLACVVAAVREQRDFFAVLDDFAVFRRDGAAMVAAAADGRAALNLAYRQVHTFKGLFLQLECAHAAKALEALEGRLSELRRDTDPAGETLVALLADPAVDVALKQDLDVVREALGAEFFERRGDICLGGAFVQSLTELAVRLLARKDALGLEPTDVAILESARALRYVELKTMLAAYPRAALRLAASQGKSLAPFVIEGDGVLVDPERFGPLAKTMVHAFRNAVDHGLESPEERAAADKDEMGRIACRVMAADGKVSIIVTDDGRGVNIGAVRARAFELGLVGAEELASMDDAKILDLLFRDGLTSRREAGDLSGRGVGLAAVRAEAARLGGSAELENDPGRGTRVVVMVPLDDQAVSQHRSANDRTV